MFGIKLYSEVSYRGTNDGHWVRLSVGAAIAAYYIPVAHAFQAIDAYRTVFRRRYDSEDEELFKINQPCEFRYVNIQPNGPILFDIPPGEYCVMEFLSFTGNEQDKIYSAMKELEDKLVAMGAYPHTAKIFGFTETPDGKMQAFNRAFFTKTSSAKGRDAFRQKQLALDPHGVFLTPHASWFLDE